MSDAVFRCHRCGAAIPLGQGDKIVRRDECPQCAADLKCCLNCLQYDTSRNNQCADSAAEWVSDKESRNFCDFFEPRLGGAAAAAKKSGLDPKKAFEDLFR